MKIKPIIAEVDYPRLPAVRAPIGVNLGLSKGLYQASQELSGAAEEWAKVDRIQQAIEQKKKEYDDLFNAATLHVQGKDRISQLAERWAVTDYGQVIPRATTDLETLKKELLEEAKQKKYSPEALKHFERDWIQVSGQAMLDARKIDNHKFKERARANWKSLADTAVEEAIAMDAPARVIHFGNIDSLTDRMMSDGLITGFEAEAFKKDLRTRAEARTRAIMDEIRKQEEKQKETEVYSFLKEKHGADFDAMIKDLQDPKKLQSWDLTVEKARNLSDILKAERNQGEIKMKDVYHQTALSLFKMMREDRLSRETIDEAISMDRLDFETGDRLKKALENKYPEKGEEKKKTDAVVFANLLTLAHTSPDRTAVKREILKNANSLEEADIEKLLTRAEGTYQEAENKSVVRGIEYIRNTVIPKRGQMEKFLSTPQEEEDLKDALAAFDSKIAAMRKGGKDLSQEEILKAAAEASQAHRKTIYERMQQMTDYMREQMKPKPKGVPSKGEYEIGAVYEDAKGNKARYLGKDKSGNHQWQNP